MIILLEVRHQKRFSPFLNDMKSELSVGSYHRFKTNDNLFYYRTSLYEGLDFCESDLMVSLVKDYMEVERGEEAGRKICYQ